MVKDSNAVLAGTDARKTVLSFITALNGRDYTTARKYVNDNMTFVGALGARNGADAYFDDMERMQLQYDIKRTFADENDVCLFYDIMIKGVNIFTCGWYHLENGKISSVRVVFDPRPLLDTQYGAHSG